MKFDKNKALRFAKMSAFAYGSKEYIDTQLDQCSIKYFSVKGVQCYIAEYKKYSVVAFAGTNELGDVFTDANIILQTYQFNGKVHNGFKNALYDIHRDIIDNLNKDKKVIFIGHSLGGALASMMALNAQTSLYDVDSIYTFGSPRWCNKEYASYYNKKLGTRTFRIVNNNDIVTKIPVLFSYYHIGRLIYITFDRKIMENIPFYKILWDRIKGRINEPILDGLTDHYKKEYIEALS